MNSKSSKQLPDNIYRENVSSGGNTYIKWVVVILTSVGVIVALGVVVYSLITPDIPDPKSADFQTVVDFTKTDAFLEMNSRDRSKYLKDMTKNFESLDLDEQKKMAKYIDGLRRKNHKDHLTLLLNFASGISEQLDGKTEEEQGVHVQRVMLIAETLQGGREEAQREYDRNFYPDGTPRNRERFMQDVRRDRKLMLRSTTAVQRVKIMRAAKKVLQEAHRKYGE